MRKNLAATRLWGLLFPLIGFLGGLGTLFVMWMGGYYLMKHRITLGDFIALNTYYMMLMAPVAGLGWIFNLYQRGVASVRRIEEIYESEPERVDGVEPRRDRGRHSFRRRHGGKGGPFHLERRHLYGEPRGEAPDHGSDGKREVDHPQPYSRARAGV